MKIIFNNYLIETDEIQAISPLNIIQLWKKLSISVSVTDGVHQSFKIFLLNKTEPLFIEFPLETEKEDAKIAYQKLADIWKDKQDKFLTII